MTERSRASRGRRHVATRWLEHPLLAAPAVGYVVVACCLPLVLLLLYSLWHEREGEPVAGSWTLENYSAFFTDSVYWSTLVRSMVLGVVAALCALIVAFPFAYFVGLHVQPGRRSAWIVAAVLPFSASYLIRVFAWIHLFGNKGILNDILLRLHVISSPLRVLGYGRTAIVVTFVYLLFPLAFLTIYVAVERIDIALLDSAHDLGANASQVLTRVVLPLAKSGVFTGFALCFVSVLGDYVTPTLVAGTNGTVYTNMVVTKFGFSTQWGFGSALALILFVAIVAFVVLLRLATGRTPSVAQLSRSVAVRPSRGLAAYSAGVVGFLYIPVTIVALLAFNTSTFTGFPVTGITLQWFRAAFNDPVLLAALRTSLRVIRWSLPISVAAGTLAAVQLSRSRWRWRLFSTWVLSLPIALPSVMVGLSIIIFLHALNITRGFWTVVGAHILIVLPIVTFIILARLEGIDKDCELAAMDLGARPHQTFLRVTLPEALPGVIAGALIGFAISMDEFLVTFLVTGHDVTLPLFIYGSLRYGVSPELNAITTVVLALSFALLAVASTVLRRVATLGRKRQGTDGAVRPAET